MCKLMIRGFLIMKRQNEYSKTTLILIFFIFSHIGWLWEVYVTRKVYGIFANRGFMYGPWLPVYGAGAVLLIVLLDGMRMETGRLFLASAVVCGALEYVTSFFLERVYHAKWWDYSGEFLNFSGRTCLTVMLLFGIAGNFVIRIAAPFFNRCIGKISGRVQRILCLVFGSTFFIDYIISLFHPNQGTGITF